MKLKFRLVPISLALVASFSIATQGSAETTTSSNTSSTSSTNPSPSPGESNVIGKTADTYSAFAGSRANAANLATGLRQGNAITLTEATADGGMTSTTFTPPTKAMGYGNVNKAMALSSQQLATAGVAQPTADQIKASMMGGTITNDAGESVELQGVLQMRADGMGWGEIAHELGVKPGQGYRPAHTGAGVTTASGASNSVATAKGKSGEVRSASADKQPKSSGVSGQRSRVVSGFGASASHTNSHSKSDDHGAASVSNSSANHSHGVVHSGIGSVTGGNGGSAGMAKGHLK